MLADDFRRAVNYLLSHLHTALPGEVLAYDPDTRLAEVKPTITRLYMDGQEIILLPIKNVPVQWPSTKAASVTLKLQRGDTGQLIFNERCIDSWVKYGGVQSPALRRMHSLSDAVFIPGVGPGQPGKPGTNKDVEVIAGGASITVDGGSIVVKDNAGGQINLTAGKLAAGATGVELMQLLVQAFTALSTATTVEDDQALTSAAALTAVIAQLELIKGSLA